MMSFYDKGIMLRRECLKFIEDTLRTMEDQKCCFLDPALDPEEDDIYFDLPVAIHFGRYDYGTTYVITNARLENDEVWFNGLSTYDYSDEFSFGTGEVETSSLTEIADRIYDLKQEQDGRI